MWEKEGKKFIHALSGQSRDHSLLVTAPFLMLPGGGSGGQVRDAAFYHPIKGVNVFSRNTIFIFTQL